MGSVYRDFQDYRLREIGAGLEAALLARRSAIRAGTTQEGTWLPARLAGWNAAEKDAIVSAAIQSSCGA